MSPMDLLNFILVAVIAIFITAEAAPLRGDGVRRRYAPRVTVYQEVFQIVAATSTVYVSPPAPTRTTAPTTPRPIRSATKLAVVPPGPTAVALKAAPSPKAHDAASSNTYTYTGKATYYAAGMGSCGQQSSDSEAVVALSASLMKNSAGNSNSAPLCGKTIKIKNTKSGVEVDATVVDTCPSCAEGDIDVTPSLFEKLAALADGTTTVSWKIT